MDDNINTPEAVTAIIDFAKARTEPQIQRFEDPEKVAPDVVAVIGHDAHGATKIDPINFNRDTYRERPIRRKGTITTTTLDSFVALVNRQSGEDSVIFADDSARPSMTAVLNFHEAGDGGEPAWGDDRITYAFPLSEEWIAWTSKNKVKFEVAEFAEFIENRLFDIGEQGSAGSITQRFAAASGVSLAGPQAIRNLSKGLSVRVEHKVARVVNLQSGEGRMEFSEEHKGDDGTPMSVPAAFHIMIPVFKSGALYSIPVRLRYRTGGGKVIFFFEIHRAELFLLDAVNEALAIVRRAEDATKGTAQQPGCGLPVFMGSI